MLRVKLWSCVFRVYVAGYGITRLFPLAIRNSIKSIHVELRGLKLPSPLQMNDAQEISQTIRISRSLFLVSRSNTASNVKQSGGKEYPSKMKMREKLHEIYLGTRFKGNESTPNTRWRTWPPAVMFSSTTRSELLHCFRNTGQEIRSS